MSDQILGFEADSDTYSPFLKSSNVAVIYRALQPAVGNFDTVGYSTRCINCNNTGQVRSINGGVSIQSQRASGQVQNTCATYVKLGHTGEASCSSKRNPNQNVCGPYFIPLILKGNITNSQRCST